MSDHDLSSYAFTTYGHDAKLYNGIHDLETQFAQAQARLDWLLEHAHVTFQSPYTEGLIMVLSVEAIDQAIQEEAARLEEGAAGKEPPEVPSPQVSDPSKDSEHAA